jgi:hypothetical protein
MQRPCTHSASYKTFQTLFQNTSISIYHPLNSLSCPRPKKPLRHYSTRTPCTTPPQPHPSVGVHTIHTPHQYHQPIPKPNTKVPEAFPKGQPPPCSTPRPIHPSFPAYHTDHASRLLHVTARTYEGLYVVVVLDLFPCKQPPPSQSIGIRGAGCLQSA